MGYRLDAYRSERGRCDCGRVSRRARSGRLCDNAL